MIKGISTVIIKAIFLLALVTLTFANAADQIAEPAKPHVGIGSNKTEPPVVTAWDLPPSAYRQQDAIESVDGRYVLTNVDDWKTYEHHLYLTDTSTKQKSLLYTYGRSGRVLWSPSSDVLIIDDAGGSDFENALLFHLPKTSGPIDIGKALLDSELSKPEKDFLRNADHLYFSAIAWIDDRQMLFMATGHDSVKRVAATFVYVYTLPGSFKLILSDDNESTAH